MRTEHLFFYGVLLGDLASPTIATLLDGLGPGRAATARGSLWAVPDSRGWYPVLLPGNGPVAGMIHEAGAVDLAALDRFEGVNRADPRAGEYRREMVQVSLASGETLLADAFLYNREPDTGFEAISHGDFTRWLRETGGAAFAG